jgi:ABC-type Fe3+-hydroxamate transport system substrate-binding protein
MTAGGETFVSEAIVLGGGRNIFGDLREPWPLVNAEQILLRRPDWVFWGNDMGGVIDLSTPFWQLFPAVLEGRVVMINADLLYRYGPRLADSVDYIAKILHGDL